MKEYTICDHGSFAHFVLGEDTGGECSCNMTPTGGRHIRAREIEKQPEPEKPREWQIQGTNGLDIVTSGPPLRKLEFVRVHDADACDRLPKECGSHVHSGRLYKIYKALFPYGERFDSAPIEETMRDIFAEIGRLKCEHKEPWVP